MMRKIVELPPHSKIQMMPDSGSLKAFMPYRFLEFLIERCKLWRSIEELQEARSPMGCEKKYSINEGPEFQNLYKKGKKSRSIQNQERREFMAGTQFQVAIHGS